MWGNIRIQICQDRKIINDKNNEYANEKNI